MTIEVSEEIARRVLAELERLVEGKRVSEKELEESIAAINKDIDTLKSQLEPEDVKIQKARELARKFQHGELVNESHAN